MLHNFLEDFSAIESAAVTVQAAEIDEDQQLDIFEEGYKAGWDDAFKAADQKKIDVAEALVSHILDQSFLYQESVARFNRQVILAVEQALLTIIPGVSAEGVAQAVSECTRVFLQNEESGKILVTIPTGKYENLIDVLSHIESDKVELRSNGNSLSDDVKISFLDEEYLFDTHAYTSKVKEIVEQSLKRISYQDDSIYDIRGSA